MANILLLYISQTGNTEMMAEALAGYLEYKEHDVEIKTFDFDPIDVEELLDYDIVFIGIHSNDDGDVPFEMEDFYEELEDVDLSETLFGVFGSGDTAYEAFCLSVDLIADRLVELNARLIPKRLKVDLAPNNNDIQMIEQFAEQGIQMIQ